MNELVPRLIDIVDMGVLVVCARGRVHFANQTLRRALGVDCVAGLEGLGLEPLSLARLRAALEERGPFRVELQQARADGPAALLALGIWTAADTIGPCAVVQFVDISFLRAREDDLRSLVITDQLTHVASRRHLLEQGERALADLQRHERPLAVALVDIDGFKRVNDVAGHATGDIVLAFVAACCADGLRRNDLIGRLGGDEFCIVMPSTELDAAVMVAERLRTLLRRAMKERPPARVDITLSIGVAAARSDDPAFGAVVARADRALLQAKSEGRDRVVVADMPA